MREPNDPFARYRSRDAEAAAASAEATSNAGVPTLADVDVYGRRVLVRCDLDYWVDVAGELTCERAIERALPTLRNIIEREGKAIVLASMNPASDDPAVEDAELHIAGRLAEALGAPVSVPDEAIGDGVGKLIARAELGSVTLLCPIEDVEGEPSAQSKVISEGLARLADVFVQDAPSVLHIESATTTGVCGRVSERCLGPRLAHEFAAFREFAEPAEGSKLLILDAELGEDAGPWIELTACLARGDTLVPIGRLATAILSGTASRAWQRWSANLGARGVEVHAPTDGWIQPADDGASPRWWQLGDDPAPAGRLSTLGPNSVAALRRTLATNPTSLLWTDAPLRDSGLAGEDAAECVRACHFVVAPDVDRFLAQPGGSRTSPKFCSASPHAWRAWLLGRALPGLRRLQ